MMPWGRVVSSSQAAGVVDREAQFGQGLDHHFRVENPHHQFFAKGGRQGRQAQLDFLAAIGARLDAAVLGAAFFDDVHAPQQFDARRHGDHHHRRHLVHLVQDAVDPEADAGNVALRFQVDVRGALFEGVLPQPVDDVDHVLVVGVELLVQLAQFDQLLEIVAQGDILAAGFIRALDRLGQGEKLGDVLRNVQRAGDHQVDLAAG